MNRLSIALSLGLLSATAVASDNAFNFFQPFQGPRAVYTETNAADKNEILVMRRDSGGNLRLVDRVATRGRGTGAALGNQGALELSPDGRRLYAINAGSNEISVFSVFGDRLVLVQKLPSGGDQPISITVKHDLMYVLNAGGDGNITGFYAGDDRRVYPIPGSTQPLSGGGTGPAQIAFDTFGDVLAVTEKNTNKIVLYDVVDGVAQAPQVRDSNGATPFGFAFDRHDNLLVSEAAGGAANASTVSSYELDGAQYPLEVISPSISGNQTAACWVAVTRNGRYAYATNTGSASVTGFSVARNGALTLLSADGVSGRTIAGSAPIDVAASHDNAFLFVLTGNVGMIHGFRIREDGSLSATSRIDGIPASASGLVAH